MEELGPIRVLRTIGRGLAGLPLGREAYGDVGWTWSLSRQTGSSVGSESAAHRSALLARLRMGRVAEAQEGVRRSEKDRDGLAPESDWVGWGRRTLRRAFPLTPLGRGTTHHTLFLNSKYARHPNRQPAAQLSQMGRHVTAQSGPQSSHLGWSLGQMLL